MTQDLTSHLLRAYFTATNWDPTQSYLHLTSTSSSILLDFPIPAGLSLSISSCSSPSTFYSTHRLRALPHLAGSLGYVFARTERPLDLAGIVGPRDDDEGRDDRLRHVLERFRIVNEPRAPSSTTPGTSSSTPRDYLLYGNIHAPTARLDALYTTRLSPTWNLILTACSFPPRNPNHAYIPTENAAAGGQGRTAPGATNLQVTVQNDVGGRWFNEWSYSVDDALWGFRTMHHFGHRVAPSTTSANANEVDTSTEPATSSTSSSSSSSSSVGGGLRGRFSAGGELFFSAAEKSAGLSTGVRFTTLPEPSDDGSPPSQPPTTITATLNPMMGHMSTAYAAQVARDVVCCSRYDFNVYSYESELTVGGEYWLRGGSGSGRGVVAAQEEEVAGGKEKARSLVPAVARETSLRAGTGAGTSRPSSSSSGSGLPQSALGLPKRELTSTAATRSHASLRDRVVDVEVEVEPPAPGTPTLPPPSSHSSLNGEATPLPIGTLPPAPAPQPPRLPPLPAPAALEPPPAPRGLLKTSFNLSTLLLSLLYQGSLSNGCIVRVGLRVDLLRGAGAGASSLGGGSKKGGGGVAGGAAGILRGVGMEVVYLGGGGGGGGGAVRGEETVRQEGTTRQPPVVVVGSGQAGAGVEQGQGVEM